MNRAGDMESGKGCHLGGIIIRSLTLQVSNYRSEQGIEEYCKEQGVIGITDVDTRELTRRLRDAGSLVSVLSTDKSKTDEELVAMAKGWKIEGKDYLSEVRHVTKAPRRMIPVTGGGTDIPHRTGAPLGDVQGDLRVERPHHPRVGVQHDQGGRVQGEGA